MLGDPIIVINEVVMSILTEDIKNTRFLLTLAGLGVLIVGILAILIVIVTGVTVAESVLVLFGTLLGVAGGIVTTAYNSYFKDRQIVEIESIKNSQ